MTVLRALVAVATGCLVGATLSACGDDDADASRSADPATEGATIEPGKAVERTPRVRKCSAEVTTTGAYEAEWQGRAKVRTGGGSADDTGPDAVYEMVDEENRVALYSPGEEFKGSVTLSVGETAYASDPADAKYLDIDPRGRSASVDVTLISIEGDSLDLVAEFTCARGTRDARREEQ